MRDERGRKVWTYVRDDDSTPVTAWNPMPGAYLPDSIDMGNGVTANLDQSSGVTQTANYTPPAEVKTVKPYTPPPPDTGKPVDVSLGWPGMTTVS